MAGDHPKHLAWVRKQPCAACAAPGPCHPHHHTHRRGHGQRASDLDAMPLCWRCHRMFHDGHGRFEALSAHERRLLQDHWVAETMRVRAQLNDPEVF